MTSARLQSLSRTSPAFLDDAPGRGCPCPHRRTFAVALRAFTLSEASALRHPWLRWPPTPTPGARAASPTPSAGRQKTKERSGPVSRVLFRGPLQARGGDHFSRTPVARGLQQPTRKLKRGGSPRVASALAGRTTSSCLALLPMGFSEPGRSPDLLVSSYLTVSPLPAGPKPGRRFAFCGTVPGLAAGGRYPPSHPVEPGLSSRRLAATGGHPARSSPSRTDFPLYRLARHPIGRLTLSQFPLTLHGEWGLGTVHGRLRPPPTMHRAGITPGASPCMASCSRSGAAIRFPS